MELRELIESIDIVEYIGQFVELTQRNEEWWGLSCFNEENTPSFSVRKNPPVFYDYSSGIGGGLYTFVKEFNHCGGRKAVEILKEYAGVDAEIKPREGTMSATIQCKRFMRKPTAKQQASIKLPVNYMSEHYEKREDKLEVWEAEGISKESLDKFGVYYDAFSDRLVYPIKNEDGIIVNVGGRTLDPEWKEKNLRKYNYFFKWGQMSVIYGLYENMDAIMKKGEVIIFEGCKSVLLADTWGIHNCGAILTSHLSPLQMKLLIKLGVRVIFALDKEIDVRKDKQICKLKSYTNVFYYRDRNNLLDEKDAPVDKGQDVFNMLMADVKRFR